MTSTYPWWTPYQFAGNSPIGFIDMDGQELSETLKDWGVDLSPAAAGFVDGLVDGISFIAMGKMVYNLTTDSKYKSDFVEAIKTAATDPVGFVKMIVEDYKEKFNNILEFNDKGKYDLGYMGGELVGNIVTGGAVALLTKYASKFKLLNKASTGVEEAADEAPTPHKRPSWQDSEKDIVTSDYDQIQASFKNGQSASDKSRGSVRPEGCKLGFSIEVKNYKLTSETGIKRMIKNVVGQVRQRNSNLPANTVQNIVLDVRGQNLSTHQMMKIKSWLMSQTGSKNINISFKTD